MNEIEVLALAARRHFGLGEGAISDLALLLENKGAIVVRTRLEAAALDAFSEWSLDDDTPYFVLNSEKQSAVRSRLDVAHELGHMVLHRHLPDASHADHRRVIEEQAFRFGSAFLAPRGAFIRSFQEDSLNYLVELKRIWGLSVSALARRASDLGLVSESRYRRIMTGISRRGWRTREPLDDELEPEQPRFLRRSIDLLLGEKIITPTNFTGVGAGSLRDVEATVGLPLGYLDEPRFLALRQSVGGAASGASHTGRIIKLADYLDA